jgi:hypothetical protein
MLVASTTTEWLGIVIPVIGLLGGLIAWLVLRKEKRQQTDATDIDNRIIGLLCRYPHKRFPASDIAGELGCTLDEVNASLLRALRDGKVSSEGNRWQCASSSSSSAKKRGRW